MKRSAMISVIVSGLTSLGLVAGILQPAQAALYQNLLCEAVNDSSSYLKVKISSRRGIVPTNEDAWTESDGGRMFQKISAHLSQGAFLSHRAKFDKVAGTSLELITEREIVALRIAKDLKSAEYKVIVRDPIEVVQETHLNCAPAAAAQ